MTQPEAVSYSQAIDSDNANASKQCAGYRLGSSTPISILWIEQ